MTIPRRWCITCSSEFAELGQRRCTACAVAYRASRDAQPTAASVKNLTLDDELTALLNQFQEGTTT
jgi:hypothetical protein